MVRIVGAAETIRMLGLGLVVVQGEGVVGRIGSAGGE